LGPARTLERVSVRKRVLARELPRARDRGLDVVPVDVEARGAREQRDELRPGSPRRARELARDGEGNVAVDVSGKVRVPYARACDRARAVGRGLGVETGDGGRYRIGLAELRAPARVPDLGVTPDFVAVRARRRRGPGRERETP